MGLQVSFSLDSQVLEEGIVRRIEEMLKNMTLHKESRVMEGHLMDDHVYVLISIPQKYAVSQFERFTINPRLCRMSLNLRRGLQNNRLRESPLSLSDIGPCIFPEVFRVFQPAFLSGLGPQDSLVNL